MDKLNLIISTNKYTGNFHREFLAYVFGYDDNTDGYADKELEAFNQEMGEELAEDYSNYIDSTRYGRYDSEYHATFIDSHPLNEEYNCDSIVIALREKLPQSLHALMKQRLDKFCDLQNQNKRADEEDLKVTNVCYYVQKYQKVDSTERSM